MVVLLSAPRARSYSILKEQNLVLPGTSVSRRTHYTTLGLGAISSTFSASGVGRQPIHSKQWYPEAHTLTSDVRRRSSLHGGGRRTDAKVDRSNSANASEPLM